MNANELLSSSLHCLVICLSLHIHILIALESSQRFSKTCINRHVLVSCDTSQLYQDLVSIMSNTTVHFVMLTNLITSTSLGPMSGQKLSGLHISLLFLCTQVCTRYIYANCCFGVIVLLATTHLLSLLLLKCIVDGHLSLLGYTIYMYSTLLSEHCYTKVV